ncbi:MAG: FAD-dependent oxidoreductase [Eubacteriaceae bacterium]|nr:FAD-dependent oxidoreductase [Eubacteriaceae bacterium]
MKHLIIGAGAAGLTAAKTIRELAPNDEIVVISSDEKVYSRCLLHRYIAGERSEESLSFVPEGFFEDNSIRWLNGVSVLSVNTISKTVEHSRGYEAYDKLLIATGAVSSVPPIGMLREARNAFGLRSFEDAKAIREHALRAENIVIIGAGLVGMDVAYSLIEMGKKPVVVEMAEWIMSVNLDRKAAGAYQELFEKQGCTFYLDKKVNGTIANASGNSIEYITLESGEILPSDMVIVAAGVRPAIAFLDGSGIGQDRSVLVNESMMTNVEGVYAAGDVAGLSGIWPNAMKQGEVAAKNMCGQKAVYDDRYALKNTINFFGLATLSLGSLNASDEDDIEIIREDRNRYEKIVVNGGQAVGIILQGEISGSGFWQYLIKNGIDISNIKKRMIWNFSYADFYSTKENGEYTYAINK